MNAALFVETRQLPRLEDKIQSHLNKLPDDYELIIYHSRQNRNLFKNIDCKKHETFISSLKDYNYFMTNTALWDSLKRYQRVLVFQNDSEILRPGIEEFYEWDYSGSPWKFQEHGGNGGGSLRNPRAMLRTCLKTAYHLSLGYEDVYFSNHLIGNLAPRNVCERFGCETIFKLGTFMAHAIDKYLTPKECQRIRNQYE
jgi:hypothetical protein